jgi:hypothetical protein
MGKPQSTIRNLLVPSRWLNKGHRELGGSFTSLPADVVTPEISADNTVDRESRKKRVYNLSPK